MLKRWICLILALLLLPAFPAACEENDLSGRWMDAWSQRAQLELTRKGDTYTARIHWANSAFEFVQWDMSGPFENGVLSADDCVKSLHSYDESGKETVEILYENEKATLGYLGGCIIWMDVESMGAECRFERMPEEYSPAPDLSDLELTDICTPLILSARYAIMSAAKMPPAAAAY